MLEVVNALRAHEVPESVLNSVKFLLVAQDIDVIRRVLEEEHPKRHEFIALDQRIAHDLEKLKLQLTLRAGLMVAAGVGVLATLVKLL